MEKCKFTKNEIEWLGYKITQTGISPITYWANSCLGYALSSFKVCRLSPVSRNLKFQDTGDNRQTLKELRAYVGLGNQMNRFIPNLSQLCFKLRPLLNKPGPVQVGAISKAQKQQNDFKKSKYWWIWNLSFKKIEKKSPCGKHWKGGQFGIFQHPFCYKTAKNLKEGPFYG